MHNKALEGFIPGSGIWQSGSRHQKEFFNLKDLKKGEVL